MGKRVVIAAVALALLAAACGGDDKQSGQSGQSQTTNTEVAQPTRGGTLVTAITSDPGFLNPAITSNGGVHQAAEPMFNGLVGWGTDGKPTPELATSWTIEGGGTVYRFTLRDGVKWHDGQPFTSDDVKFTFEKALLPLHSRTKASLGTAGVTVETPDPKTVVFRFPNPYGPLLQQLNVTEAPIIPKHVYESCADISTAASCPANKTPVGTGPFKLDSYSPTEIRMSRNPNYFRPGQPYLDGYVERVIPDSGTQVLALQNKEIDYLGGVPGAQLATLKADKNITLGQTPRGTGGGNCISQVIFNMKPAGDRKPFFVDQRMREAFARATDRQKLWEQVQFGTGRVADAPISSAIPFAHASGLTLPTFDVAKAKSLLDQVGWKDDGKGTRVAHGVANIPDGTDLVVEYDAFAGDQTTFGEAMRAQLKDVGIQLDVKTMDNPTLTANVFTRRTFDTAVASYCNGDDPEIGVRRQYDSKQISATAFSNGAGYSNPEVDSLLDQGAREVDPAKRTPIYRKLQEIAVRDLPYWWLTESVGTVAFNSACTGFNLQNTGLFAEGASCKK